MKKNTLTIVLFLFFISGTYSQTGDKTITYDKGKYYQYGQVRKHSEIKYILANDSASASEYHKYRVTKGSGVTTLVVGYLITGAGLVWVLASAADDMYHMMRLEETEPLRGTGLLAVGTGVIVVGAVILIANPHFKRSINLYNSSAKNVSCKPIQLDLTIKPNGLAVIMKF